MKKYMTVRHPTTGEEVEYDYASGRDLVNNAGWTEIGVRTEKAANNPTPPDARLGIIDPAAIYEVVDLSGTKHEMTWVNASDMARNMGWTIVGKASASDAAPASVEATGPAPTTPAQPSGESVKEPVAQTTSVQAPEEPAKRKRRTKAEMEAARAAEAEAKGEKVVPPTVPAVPEQSDDPLLAEFVDVTDEELTAAAKACEIEVDAAWDRLRLITEIEMTVDARLTESGDFDGAEVVDSDDAEEVVKQKLDAQHTRRQRAYVLEGERQGFEKPETIPPFATMLKAMGSTT